MNNAIDPNEKIKADAEILKERNNAKSAITTHEYYTFALQLEKTLVRMNLILTIISILAMLFEIGYGLAV